MFLSVIGNSRRRQKILMNVLWYLIIIGLLILGAFTIKKNTYVDLDSWAIAQEIAENATAMAMENGTANIIFVTLLWNADMDLVNTIKELMGPPKRDFLLAVNAFIGVADDIYDKFAWYPVIFSFVGALVYGWNVLRSVIWIDHKLEGFLDDMSIYEQLGNEDEFSDFVLDLRKQKAEMGKVEIKSTTSLTYDIKSSWRGLSRQVMKAFLPISPALLYCSFYTTSLFLLSCYHTWMRSPNELSENMRMVTNFAVGLQYDILAGKRDVNSYVFVLWGIWCQILFFFTCYRVPEMIVRVYNSLVGKEDSVRPAFLNSIQADDVKEIQKRTNEVETKKDN